MRAWNIGTWFVFLLALEDFAAAAAFLYSRNYVKAAYWFFAGCICATTMFF